MMKQHYELQCYENPMKMSLKTQESIQGPDYRYFIFMAYFSGHEFLWKVDNGFHGSWNCHEISGIRVHEPWKVGVL